MKVVVVVIDMINDFVTGKIGSKGAVSIIPKIRNLLAAARNRRIPIIYMCDAHSRDDPEIRVWGEHAMAGTEGSQVIPELKPEKGELVLPKHTYNVFCKTKLGEALQKMRVKELVLVGVTTDICVQNSAAGAFFHGYTVVVPEDCVASLTVKAHKYALDYMGRVYGAKVTNSSEIIKGWRK